MLIFRACSDKLPTPVVVELLPQVHYWGTAMLGYGQSRNQSPQSSVEAC